MANLPTDFTASRIAVVGPGALGLFFGGVLTRFGLDVRFLHKSRDRAADLGRHGLILDHAQGTDHIPLRATADASDIGLCPLILVCVKSYDTALAASALAPLLGPDTIVLTLQNGLGHVEVLARTVPKEQIAVGVTFQGVTLLKPGHIRHAGAGGTCVGAMVPSPHMKKRLASLAGVLSDAGLTCEAVDNIEEVVWNKLLVNVGINALSALTGLKNGDLIVHPELCSLMRNAIEETTALARRKGIHTDPKALEHAVQACRATAENRSSMLQDVVNRKRTEIEAINGAVVREAKELGINTPVNETLSLLITVLGKTYDCRVRS